MKMNFGQYFGTPPGERAQDIRMPWKFAVMPRFTMSTTQKVDGKLKPTAYARRHEGMFPFIVLREKDETPSAFTDRATQELDKFKSKYGFSINELNIQFYYSTKVIKHDKNHLRSSNERALRKLR